MATMVSYVIALLDFVSLAQALSAGLAGASRDPPGGAWRPPPDYAIGTSNHKTMYLADIVVGGESSKYRLLVDTGSSLLVVPGAHCKSRACAQHRRLDEGEGKATGRTAAIGYGMGSIKGHMLRDKVCLPSPDGTEALDAIGFLQLRAESGCAEMSVLAADEESDDFASSSFDGILGLGLPDLDVFEGSCLLERLHEAGQISSTDFSLQLGETGESELVLGGVDEHSLAGPGLLWVPLSPAAGSYWQFSVLDIAVDGKPLQIGRFDVLLDSGTSLISADPVVRNTFMEVASPSSDCSSVNSLPKVTLVLSSDISLPFLPSDYVDRASGECSLALMPGEFGGVNGQRMVLGDSFMRRYVTTFDRVNRRIGFGVNAGDKFQDQLLPNMFPGQTSRPRSATSAATPDVNSKSNDGVQSETSRQQNRVDTLSNMFPPSISPSMISSAPPNMILEHNKPLSPALELNPEKELLHAFPLSPPPPTLRGSLPDINSNDDGYAQSTMLGPPNPQEAPLNTFPLSPPPPIVSASPADINLNDDDYSQSSTLGPPNQQGALPKMIQPSPPYLASGALPDVNSENNEYARSLTLGPLNPQEALPDMIRPVPPSWTASGALPDVNVQHDGYASASYRPLTPVQVLIKQSQLESADQQAWFGEHTILALSSQMGTQDPNASTVPPADDLPPAGDRPPVDDLLSDAVSAVIPTPSQAGVDISAKMKVMKNNLLLRNPYMNHLNLIQSRTVFASKSARRQIVLPLVRSQ